jgi:hypothetical protein
MAVNFMENAVRNGTDPTKFAQTARNLVPGDVLSFIQRVGIDTFLDKVIDANSPLASVRGRQFARQVAKILVQGETPPAPPALEAVDPGEVVDGVEDGESASDDGDDET